MSGSGVLYIVATPIGNLDDLTVRARDTLRAVEVCYAEDTRRTGRLLRHVGSRTALRSLHAHNEEARSAEMLASLAEGRDVAVVTDAGTPGVSDPGRRVVAAALLEGHRVVPIPGPSAVPAALSVSGFPADRFLFAGFAPRKGRSRAEWLDEVVASPITVVIFEAPGRLVDLLEALAEGGARARQAVVCRELTKLHEEVRAGAIAELATVYTGESVKGEVTVVLAGAEPAAGAEFDVDEALAVVQEGRAAGNDRRTIAETLRKRFGVSRNEAYRLSLAAREGRVDD